MPSHDHFYLPLHLLFESIANKELSSAQKIKSILDAFGASLRVRLNPATGRYEDLGNSCRPLPERKTSSVWSDKEIEKYYQGELNGRRYEQEYMLRRSQGLAVNITQDGYELGLIHMAVIYNDLDLIKWLHEELGADLNLETCWGYTPLMFAAEHNHVEVMKYLISKGARLDQKTKVTQAFSAEGDIIKGRSALHVAVRYGRLEACQVLLEAKARFVEDEYGRNPYDDCRRYLELISQLEGKKQIFSDDFGDDLHRDPSKIPSLEILCQIRNLLEEQHACVLHPEYNWNVRAIEDDRHRKRLFVRFHEEEQVRALEVKRAHEEEQAKALEVKRAQEKAIQEKREVEEAIPGHLDLTLRACKAEQEVLNAKLSEQLLLQDPATLQALQLKTSDEKPSEVHELNGADQRYRINFRALYRCMPLIKSQGLKHLIHINESLHHLIKHLECADQASTKKFQDLFNRLANIYFYKQPNDGWQHFFGATQPLNAVSENLKILQKMLAQVYVSEPSVSTSADSSSAESEYTSSRSYS